jgi:hypothetical protein
MTLDEEKFWAQVSPEPNTGCWLWTLACNFDGYGSAWFKGALRRAHRVAWEMTHGPIPGRAYVCHRCDVPACVNPAHLFLGTQTDNMRDMATKGRDRKARGSRVASSKLTEEQVASIRARYASGGVTQTDLSREFGVSQVMVSKIVRRAFWAHVEIP